eukprot:GHRQ01018392.1.p1 GENE.GHRQ01018392.1~~GHRQ01018392.1.p1  ORF type:complete len:173 (-),score=42.18 GHRQ01018392.1:432-950(-)
MLLALPLQRQSFDPASVTQVRLHWTAGPDKDCLHANARDVLDDETCSSRGMKHCKQQHTHQQLAEDQAALDVFATSCSDHMCLASQRASAVADQDVHSLQWQQLPNSGRDPALRAAQQQEELMDMIRCAAATHRIPQPQQLAAHQIRIACQVAHTDQLSFLLASQWHFCALL